MNQLIKKLCIAILSTALALSAIEVGLRIYYSKFISYDIEMWKYHQKIKIPTNDLRRHFHKSNAQAELMGVTLRTNSLGFRGPELDMQNISNSIVMLGDSLTLGWGVDESDTFCQRYAADHGVNCINAGVGNYNLEQIVENYRKNPVFSQAKQVFYFFYINDAEPAQLEFNSEFCIHSIACVAAARAIGSSHSNIRNENDYVQYYENLYMNSSWQRYADSLEALISAVGKERLTVILLPEFRYISSQPFKDVHQKISEYLIARGVRVFDFLDFPSTANSQEFWVSPDDPHPNAKAHKIIADQLKIQVTF